MGLTDLESEQAVESRYKINAYLLIMWIAIHLYCMLKALQ